MIAITQLNKEQWYAVSPRQDREWAKNWGIYALYAEDGLHQLAVDGEPVSFHATYFAKGKKADGWGKYANFYRDKASSSALNVSTSRSLVGSSSSSRLAPERSILAR